MGHDQDPDRLAGDSPAGSPPEDSRHSSLLVVLSGPSGVGKDAVMDGLRDRLRGRDGYHFAVTATTRPMRPGEREGEPYRFLSVPEFEDLLANNGLLEHAVVYGNRYGTPKDRVSDALSRGETVFLKVDVQGARSVRQIAPDAVTIFIAAPSLDVLRERLTGRKTDTPEEIESRLSLAGSEMEERRSFDHAVVNHQGRLRETIDSVLRTVEAERRSGGQRRYDL